MRGAMAGCLATIGRVRCSSSSGATKAVLATVRPTNMAVLSSMGADGAEMRLPGRGMQARAAAQVWGEGNERTASHEKQIQYRN